MKKTIITIGAAIVALIGINSHANAQSAPVRYGIKAGATFMTLGSATSNGISINYNYRPGFQGGFFVDVPLSETISFNPQLLYTQKGGDINTTISNVNVKGYSQVNYLDLPLLFGFKANPKLAFFVGPQVSFLSSHKTSLTTSNGGSATSTDKTGLKNTILGGNLGAGYEINNNVGINLNYLFDLGNAGEGANDSGERNSGFALTLGVKF